MMKVYWIVSNYPHEYDVQAGVFYKALAEQIVLHGVDLTVIAPVPFVNPLLARLSLRYRRMALSPAVEDQNGVRIYRPRYITHPREANVGIAHGWMLRAIKKLHLPEPDLVHGFGSYPASYTAGLFARECRVPFVTTFIGSDVNVYPKYSKGNLQRFIRTVEMSVRVLCASRDMIGKVKKITDKDAQIMFMPLAPLAEIQHSRREIAGRYGFDPDKFTIIYAGNLYATKGINELCDALDLLNDHPEIQAVFVGGTSPLLSRVQSLKNGKYLGQIPRERVVELMRASDVLVLPSYSEAIPSVIKEAGQVGLPVIATRVGGIPEIISDESGYLISSHNVSAIREAVLHVKEHYTEAQEKANVLKEFVLREYDADAIAVKQIDIYKSILQAH